MPHKVRRALGVAGLGLGLVFAMAPAASAGSNGVNVGGAAVTVPVIVCGNAANVLGAVGASAYCEGVNAHPSSVGVLDAGDEAGIATPLRAMMAEEGGGNTSSGVLNAGDSNGANIGGIAATVPVVVCGNAANVAGGIGARAHCRGVNGGHGGNASNGGGDGCGCAGDNGGNSADGALLGEDSNGLNAGGLAATVPVDTCGNALNVLLGIGAEGHCEGANG